MKNVCSVSITVAKRTLGVRYQMSERVWFQVLTLIISYIYIFGSSDSLLFLKSIKILVLTSRCQDINK